MDGFPRPRTQPETAGWRVLLGGSETPIGEVTVLTRAAVKASELMAS